MRIEPFSLSAVAFGGGGKTEFLLTLPRPIYIIAMDPNTRAIIRRAKREGRADGITVKYVVPPALAFDERDDVQVEAQEKWDEIRDHLRPIIKDEIECASVGFDTACRIYNLGVLATFGKDTQIPPEVRKNMMGVVNSRWQGIVSALEHRGKNVCLLHRAREKWVDTVIETQHGSQEGRKQLTGPFDMERDTAAFKGTDFMVSTEIYLGFDPNRKTKTLSGKYGMKVVRSLQRPGLIGQTFWGRETIDGKKVRKASWPYLSTLLYPGTKVSDFT